MTDPRGIVTGGIMDRLFGRLRFPQLFAVLGGLLLLDLILPDPVPLLDELILAALTMAVGSWRVRDPDPFVKPPEKNVTPRD